MVSPVRAELKACQIPSNSMMVWGEQGSGPIPLNEAFEKHCLVCSRWDMYQTMASYDWRRVYPEV